MCFFPKKNPKKASSKYNVKCLPIVFCLDISSSMARHVTRNGKKTTRIKVLNEAVNNLLEQLRSDNEIRSAAEVAFVTFTNKPEIEIDFVPLRNLKTPVFRAVPGSATRIHTAVTRALEMLDRKIRLLDNIHNSYYRPFLILVTDGTQACNEADRRAQEEVVRELERRLHASSVQELSQLLFRFVIAIGDKDNLSREDYQSVKAYSRGFEEGFFTVDDDLTDIGTVFKLVGNSVTSSINIPPPHREEPAPQKPPQDGGEFERDAKAYGDTMRNIVEEEKRRRIHDFRKVIGR